MYAVYALIDPRNDAVRYIGLTNDLSQRFAQHLECDGSNRFKDAWIQDVRGKGLQIQMRTLETMGTQKEASTRESHWIQHYLAKGANLTNIRKLQEPRNTQKNRYFTVAIPRQSLLLQMVEEAHSQSNIPESQLILLYANEYVRLMRNGKR